MTKNKENQEIWAYDNIEVDENGYVMGSAYTHQFNDGYDVVASVYSYEYERNGETKMNHVPHVVVTDPDGSIVTEPHADDSQYPQKAIERAKGTAECVFQSPEQFIS